MGSYSKLIFVSFIFSFITTGCVVAPKTVRHQVDEGAVANEARKQRELALRNYYSQHERLHKAAWPILQNNTDLCEGNLKNSRGFFSGNVYIYKDQDQQLAAREALGFDNHVRIFSVMPGGPAELAGFQNGDILKKVNNKVIPSTKEGMEILNKINKADIDKDVWEFEIEKQNGSIVSVPVKAAKICNYGIKLSESDAVNAFADGNNIILTQGMMRFIESDKELSLVVGHEIAHNIMGHITAKKTNYILGTLVDLAAAAAGVDTQNVFGKASASAFSQDFEAEADYVGMYLIAKAGYEIEGSADFWRRMAAIHPGSISSNHAASHPATPHRFVEIEKSVSEIQQKISSGEALSFNMKPKNESRADDDHFSNMNP
jgi:hypothetical protein